MAGIAIVCSVPSVPAPLRASACGAPLVPLAQSTSRGHLPPPFPLHRPSSGLLTHLCHAAPKRHVQRASLDPITSAQDLATATLTTSCTAACFPRMTTHRRCHHAQLPTITLTLFQPSPTSPTTAHLRPPTAKLLNRGCSKLHQVFFFSFSFYRP
ncbi:hypothetical protein GUJ93_ZPchr0308g33401 [Zizania palustris]|uniref:Uncharacterized protein n=1 Tax=Zizania palustris TaxID=103762 RepID=A0A8J5UUF0_ZIZPA|nr:hypothetical protein GUJ93_ZPchr0308g33401 [Zizania palustris]